ncbi:MAG: nucleotidyltransferase family protein [Verrucomicrobia bacterium]|nr:nucleotidyltransferase family protein [Verrucomicrobiota bacterium]
MSADFRLGVVILAAGASSRMGRPKLLLPWGATTVVGHLIAQWKRQSAEQVVVVCAQGDTALSAELDGLQFPQEARVFNPDPTRGMFSSIQCAARWSGWRTELSHWAITLGDQPHLKAETLRALLEFARAHPEKICQPLWQEHRKHPVVLPAKAFGRLGTTGEQDLSRFLQAMSVDRAFCEINDPGLEVDIDHPSDYERALALAASSRVFS